jgi:hypothetical protein
MDGEFFCRHLASLSPNHYTVFYVSINQNGKNISSWDVASDHRIKEDIKKANLQTCYDNVKNINLYRFKYIDGFKITF